MPKPRLWVSVFLFLYPLMFGTHPVAAQTPAPAADVKQAAQASPLIKHLNDELTYSMENLKAEDGTKPYYISYSVYDETTSMLSAGLGAIAQDQQQRDRNLNIDLRVGSYELDNTHQIRGSGGGEQVVAPR